MKIAAITCSVVMWLTSIFSMAVPIPYLPYVPPHDAQLWDMVFNVFGITAPDIEDAEERAAAYWNIYRDALGAGYDAFEQDMRDVFDTAKTGGSLVLGAGTAISLGVLEQGMDKALTDGVAYGEIPEAPTLTEIGAIIKAEFETKYGQTMGTDCANSIAAKWLELKDSYPWLLLGKDAGSTAIMRVYFSRGYYLDNIVYVMYSAGDKIIVSRTRDYINALSFSSENTRNNYYCESYSDMTIPYGNINSYEAQPTIANVAAQSAAVAAAIGMGTLIPVTADTVLNNGVIDDTKPVKIRLPLTDLPVGAKETNGLTGVQEKLDAVPDAEVQDLAETIQEMQEKQAAKYGDTGTYAVDLTSYFPFCIPFDLYKMLLALGAEPEAPSIDFPMITGIEDGVVQTVNLHISLEFMDNLMQFIRTGELIFATLGLAMLTAKVIKW